MTYGYKKILKIMN